jgi:hypothetical protein
MGMTLPLMAIIGTKTSARLVYDKASGKILGIFKDWREANPTASIMQQGPFGTVNVGHQLSQYKHDAEARKALGLEALHTDMIKRHNEQEAARYEEAKKIALPRLAAMRAALAAISKEHGCWVDYTMEGDTHGIHESHLDLCTTVNGITFKEEA